MKPLFTAIALFITSLSILAQSPDKMSYQAVIRNSEGQLVSNSPVGMRIGILQGAPDGTVVFQETYNPNPQTNANGLVSLEIGGGLAIVGTFAGIDWAAGPYFLKTESDPAGGTNYSIEGVSQLLSVPYSQSANVANYLVGNYPSNTEFITTNNLSGSAVFRANFGHDNTTTHVDFDVFPPDNTAVARMRFFRSTNTTGHKSVQFYRGNNTTQGSAQIGIDGVDSYFQLQGGNFGIGTSTPARTLHVNSVMRLEPISAPPSNPAKGDIYFDSVLNKLRVYDGAVWQNCW